jgi:hypothetical protein
MNTIKSTHIKRYPVGMGLFGDGPIAEMVMQFVKWNGCVIKQNFITYRQQQPPQKDKSSL